MVVGLIFGAVCVLLAWMYLRDKVKRFKKFLNSTKS